MKQTVPAMLILWLVSACAAPGTHVVGQGSSLSQLSSNLARQIHTAHNIAGRSIQISPNNFWESQTRMNLPFSTVLCDALSTDLAKLGARITLQATGARPLIIVGNYHRARCDMAVTLRLRRMGDHAGTDLAVARDRISVSRLDPAWLTPEFSRLARTLVRLLEDNYTGVARLSILSTDFMPAGPSQPELALGPEFGKYMATALSVSPVFVVSGRDDARFRLKGDYARMGEKILFHVAVTDQDTGKQITGASVEVRTADVPGSLLLPRFQSIESIAGKLGKTLLQTCQNRPDFTGRTSLVYIGKNSFHDAGLKSMIPLSLTLSGAFTKAFSTHPMFTVTDNPCLAPDLILSGTVHRTVSGLEISAGLLKSVPKGAGQILETIAFDREILNTAHCREEWFDADLRGKTGYLMQRLELKGLAHVPGSRRPDLVINPFKYQNAMHYSKFSDYLNGYMLDYFSESRYFTPVKNIAKRIRAARTRGIRSIVPTDKPGGAAAALARAEYYIEGSFWPVADDRIEIKAALNSVSGRILASEHILISRNKIDPSWLEIDETAGLFPNPTAMNGPETSLAVELLTDKGRTNLSYARGEKISFIVKANKNVYVKLYNVDADRRIQRIYPNAFTPDQDMVRAGGVLYIPDTGYSADFSFQVQGKTGNEMVFAVASDRPLPDLPGSRDTGFYGVRKVRMDMIDIRQWFSDYARKHGIYLSWDILPVKTY